MNCIYYIKTYEYIQNISIKFILCINDCQPLFCRFKILKICLLKILLLIAIKSVSEKAPVPASPVVYRSQYICMNIYKTEEYKRQDGPLPGKTKSASGWSQQRGDSVLVLWAGSGVASEPTAARCPAQGSICLRLGIGGCPAPPAPPTIAAGYLRMDRWIVQLLVAKLCTRTT
jgi:hypothetical protein